MTKEELLYNLRDELEHTIRDAQFPTWSDLCVEAKLAHPYPKDCKIAIWGEVDEHDERTFSVYIFRKDDIVTNIFSESTEWADLRIAIDYALEDLKLAEKREENRKRKPKYVQGAVITSLDELMKQKAVFFNGKVTVNGWFQNWQLIWAKKRVESGQLFKAIEVIYSK